MTALMTQKYISIAKDYCQTIFTVYNPSHCIKRQSHPT